MGDNPYATMEDTVAKGEMLAESKWAPLVKGLEGLDRAHTAVLLENTSRWVNSIDETTRAVNVGNFDRFAFV